MNISFPYPGRVIADAESGWALFQPILFENVASGPDGFVTIHIKSLDIDNAPVFVESSPTILSSQAGNRDPKREQQIERPIFWQPDAEGDNRLAVLVRPIASDTSPVPLGKAAEVVLCMNIVFPDGVTIDLCLSGTLKPTGVLELSPDPRRITRSLVLLGNLIFLSSLTGLIFSWNYFYNSDVYLQNDKFSQQAVVMLAGSLLTFFGLSLSKIKGWFALLSDSVSFLRYPEIHLGRTLYRSLASKVCTVVLVLGATATGLLVNKNWSVPTPEYEGLVLLDKSSKSRGFVKTKRVYKRMVATLQGDRFQIVCDRKEGHPGYRVSSYYGLLGSLDGSKPFPNFVPVSARYESSGVGVTAEEDTRPASAWFSALGIASTGVLAKEVPGLLCNVPSDRYSLRDGRVVTMSVLPGGEIDILIEDQREISDSDLIDFMRKTCRANIFKKFGRFDLFKARTSYLESLEDQFIEFLGKNGVIAIPAALSVTEELLEEVRQAPPKKMDKVAIERSLFLRAMWRIVFASNRSVSLTEADIDRLAHAISDLLSTDRGWKTERVVSEVGLELVRLAANEEVSLKVHKAIVSRWLRLGDCRSYSGCDLGEYFSPSLNYVALIFHSRAFGLAQQDFIMSTWSTVLSGQTPTDVSTTIVHKETSARARSKQVIDDDLAIHELGDQIERYLRGKRTV